MAELIHASAAARRCGGVWLAVLLCGPSGAGKSDLTLRLAARGWRLVGDDYCHVWASGGALHVRGDPRIADRLEARGVGLVHPPARSLARVGLFVDCVHEAPERLPEPAWRQADGIDVPVLALRALEASAAAKVDAVLEALGGGRALA